MYLASTKKWYLERIIYLMAGVFTLAGVGLGYFVSPYWYILDALVGVNLIIFSLTGFCIMSNILYRFGVQPNCETKN